MKELISGQRLSADYRRPIGHTMSPAMHNAAFKSLGMDYVYVPFKVKSMELRKSD